MTVGLYCYLESVRFSIADWLRHRFACAQILHEPKKRSQIKKTSPSKPQYPKIEPWLERPGVPGICSPVAGVEPRPTRPSIFVNTSRIGSSNCLPLPTSSLDASGERCICPIPISVPAGTRAHPPAGHFSSLAAELMHSPTAPKLSVWINRSWSAWKSARKRNHSDRACALSARVQCQGVTAQRTEAFITCL